MNGRSQASNSPSLQVSSQPPRYQQPISHIVQQSEYQTGVPLFYPPYSTQQKVTSNIGPHDMNKQPIGNQGIHNSGQNPGPVGVSQQAAMYQPKQQPYYSPRQSNLGQNPRPAGGPPRGTVSMMGPSTIYQIPQGQQQMYPAMQMPYMQPQMMSQNVINVGQMPQQFAQVQQQGYQQQQGYMNQPRYAAMSTTQGTGYAGYAASPSQMDYPVVSSSSPGPANVPGVPVGWNQQPQPWQGEEGQPQQFQYYQAMPTSQPYMQQQTPQQPGRPSSTGGGYQRERKIIRIQDPNSMCDITDDIINSASKSITSNTPPQSTTSSSRGTPVDANVNPDVLREQLEDGPVSRPPDIAAEFAARVAATLKPDNEGPVTLRPDHNSAQSITDNSTNSESERKVTITAPPPEETKPVLPEGPKTVPEPEMDSHTSKPELHQASPDLVSHSVPLSVKSEQLVSQEPNKSEDVRTSTSDNSNLEKSSASVEDTESIPTPSPPINEVVAAEESSSVEAPPTQEPETKKETVPEETPAAAADGKEKRGKKKKGDINEKGKAKEGTDMDLFTDEASSTPKTAEPKPDVIDAPTPAPAPTVPPKEEEVKVEITVSEPEKDNSVETEVSAEEAKVQEKNERNDEKSVEAEKSQPTLETEKPVTKNKSMELKYTYHEDQWSPINTEGKKAYDRSFLLVMQNDPLSRAKPEGLPLIPDVVLDKPQETIMPNRRPDFFSPGYVQPMYENRRGGRGSMGKDSRNHSRQKDNVKIIQVPNMDVKTNLHQSENAWKSVVKDPSQIDAELKLYRDVRAILNKLTPQKFQTLVDQIANLEINTEERLKGVIDLIFEKAIDEPNFSVPYAHLCQKLSTLKVPKADDPTKQAQFRVFLLSRCQKEFEKNKTEEIDVNAKREAIQQAEDEDKKKVLIEEFEIAVAKSKRRSLGNIRFIGELFKLKMLTPRIMHECVMTLLNAGSKENNYDEDSLECLCRLLTTIGKELDQDKDRSRVDSYFRQIRDLVESKKTTPRVRFMMRDVIDLRLNKWVPRRDNNNPKTIDEIHREVAKEQHEKMIMLATAPPVPTPKRGSGGRGGRGPGQMGGEDGWKTVSSQRTPIDPSKMKFTKTTLDENNIQLGPGGPGGRWGAGAGTWGRGSGGGSGSKAPQQSNEEGRPSTPSNRFSALRQDDGSDSYNRQMRGTGRGLGRDMKGGPPRGGRGSMERSQDRDAALAAARNIGSGGGRGGSRRGSRDDREAEGEPDSRQQMVKTPEPAPAAAPTKELTPDEMQKKATAILDEYLHLLDLKEAVLCVQELNCPKNMQLFVSTALNHVLERSPQARKHTGDLLHDLIQKDLIGVEKYIEGLTETLEYSEDMEIDIPKIWEYLGELIGPMIQDGTVPLSNFKEMCKPLTLKAHVLMSCILHDASNRLGHLKVGELWKKSGLQWTDFIRNKMSVDEFVEHYKLGFTLQSDAPPSPKSESISLDEVQSQLRVLLAKSSQKSNEDVFDWIEANFGEPTPENKKFIRALMTEVCSSAIQGSGSSSTLDELVLKSRSYILQRYLDHHQELELQALYALQALVHKLEHPPNLLHAFFNALYDQDVISEDAFMQWQDSKDASEQEGKNVAVKAVHRFYTWLQES